MAAAMEIDDEVATASSDKSSTKKRFEVKKVFPINNAIIPSREIYNELTEQGFPRIKSVMNC